MTTKVKRTPSKGDMKGLWLGAGLFGLALAARLVHLYGASKHPTFLTPIVDSGEYNRIAQTLAEGEPMGPEFFWQVFFYPYFLSRIYSLFGYSIVAAKVIQAVLGSIVCVLVYLLGKRIFDRPAGVLAGCVAALYGPLIFFEGELLATGLAAFWAAVLMLLLMNVGEKKGLWFYFVLGLSGGLAVITRVTFLPFCAAAALWTVYALRRSSLEWKAILRKEILILAGFLLVTGAVAFKNKTVTGRFSFLPETGPLNLYMGNNPDTSEIMAKRPGAAWDGLLNMPVRQGAKTRAEAREFFMDRFRNYVFTRPLHFTGRMARKLVHLASSREISSNLDMYAMRKCSPLLGVLMWKAGGFGFPFGILLPLSLLGLFLHRRRLPLHVYLFWGLYSLAIILVFVTARYRAPMIPILAVPAAAAVLSIAGWIKAKHWSKAAAGILPVGLMAFLFSVAGPFAAEEVDFEAEMYYCLGIEEERLGNHPEAAADLEEAIRIDPAYGDAHGYLGYVLIRMGKKDEALEHLKRAVAINPDLDSAHVSLGGIHLEAGRLDEAAGHYGEAVRINPMSVETRQKLGSILGQMGKPKEAAKQFKKALEINPHSHVLLYKLGVALFQQGNFEEAAPTLRRALIGFENSGDRSAASMIKSLLAQIAKMKGGT